MNAKRLFALGNQRRHNDRVAIQPPQDKTPAQPVHFRKIHRLGNVHAKQQQQQRQKQRQQQQQQQRQKQQQQQQQRQRQEMQKLEDRGITFKIQTTKYLLNIANSLKSILHNMKFSASVMSSEEISREIESGQETPGVHYIFLCIGHMFHLPKKSKYYIYNLEQVNYHPDFPLLGLVDNRAEFINTAFKNADTIFDYSKMNITNYPEDFKNKALYLPIPLFEGTKSKVTDIEKEYDVLFFGGLNDRRKKILKYLEQNTDMNVRIVTNVFGDALYDIVKKSRIILNIHFKGESLLETARIHDCIRHSTPLIISEESIDRSTMEEYKDIVKFVPVIKEDLSNINELTEGIQNLLSNKGFDNIRWEVERKMQDMIKKRFDYFSINIGTIKSKFKFWYNMMNSDLDKILKIDMKLNHRYKCFESIPILRNRIINNFGSLDKETILIEFRPFPHLEFLLRNTIIKLPMWNHTVVCGNKNYDLMVNICNSICGSIDSKITIIKLNIDNLTPSEYSKLLLTKEFWEKFSGEKLLVYQEDSMLFHNKIEPFLKFDYVGAPWPVNQDDNSYGVGNGGFSLRSKSKILKCIEKIKPEDLKLGKSTRDYMNNTKSTFVPEDVYFSKSMIDYNIGIVAPRDIAKEFSQETQLSKNPLGGHNYWLSRDIFKVAGNCENIGVYSPYDYIMGGGEYYISMLIKFFIKWGCKSVHFYNNTNKKIFDKTLTKFFTSTESFIIKQINTNSLEAPVMYDFFIEMGNSQYPRITTNISRKFIYHCQFPFDYYDNKTIKPVSNVDYIILNSDYTKKYYMRKLHKNDHCKLQINYPICFNKQSNNQPLKEKNTFVMIGRIHMPNPGAHNKCQLDIIKIFRQFLSEGIPFKLYIIGTVQSQSYYKYLKQFEVEKRIEIIGSCSEEKKNKIIDKCQYHIHATGINQNEEKRCFRFEHFGISTIECINRSCIPICVNGGFFPYYIEDRKNGFLYNTTAELTKLLKQILASETLLLDVEKCHKLNKKIIEKFSESYFYDRLANMLLQ